MNKTIGLLIIAALAWTQLAPSGWVSLGPGVMVDEIPRQSLISSPSAREHEGYTITDVAYFDLKARVLAKEDYHFDRGAELSPTDLALGWGRMSDERIIDQIAISQSGRFYYWRVRDYPIPHAEIVSSSANMHLIPANDQVRHALDRIRPGELIELSGRLVNVHSMDDDWRWKTSTRRNDSGAGACELIWVEHLQVVTP